MRLNQDQKLIKNLLGEDRKDRSSKIFKKYHDQKRLSLISKRDRRRIDIVSKILRKNPELRGVDYFRAGLLFQHGQSLGLIKKAQSLASRSMDSGYEPGKWLYAATTDRMLMMVGKKQKFGTQFRRRGELWELHPVQKETTDIERRSYNVLPLQKIRMVVSSINREAKFSRFPKVRIGLTRQK